MTSLPEDLGPNWTVVAKPEGQRVLIFAHNGRTIARLRNGRVMSRFASPLPGGSPQNKRLGKKTQANLSLVYRHLIYMYICKGFSNKKEKLEWHVEGSPICLL